MCVWVGLELAMEVKVFTDGAIAGRKEMTVEIETGGTCADVIKQLENQLPSGKGAWHLEEEWQGCRCCLELSEPVPVGGVVTLHLTLAHTAQTIADPVKRYNMRKGAYKRMSQQFLQSPDAFLSHGMLRCRQLHCVHTCLRRMLDKSNRKYSATLLQRLASNLSLWGPQAASPLQTLMLQFNALEDENLLSSTEVSDLNIKSTRVQQQIALLSGKARELEEDLTHLQAQVKRRRNERGKNAPKNVEQMKTELAKLNKDLEMKNQLNITLSSKLMKVKDHLTKQRSVLEDRKKQVEKLRGWDVETQDNSMRQAASSMNHMENASQSHSQDEQAHEMSQFRSSPSPISKHTPGKRTTPSSSKKRHGSIIEAKSRQLVEEEGQAFRKHQIKKPSRDTNEEPNLLTVPPPDSKWYKETAETSQRSGVKKRVEFDAEAIVLNAALEGELSVIKDCIRKLGGCGYSNGKGVTCLHNAVCSGDVEVVGYLVDLSCDINAQDIDGWTPLHCAVAYCNLEVIRYLLEHGASLFLMTRDGDTPLAIAQEELKLVKAEQQSSADVLTSATKCLEYLQDMESGLGLLNGGVVFALFNRAPGEPGELTLREGERLTVKHSADTKWWEARNGRGKTGEIPMTYLGLYKRVRDVL